jgi:molybdopterin-guanine dinucleotide biosynthesis protein A
MGQDKARLPIHSHLLLEDVAGKVRGVADNIALVGRASAFSDLSFDRLDDCRPGNGPLGGIQTALQAHRGELNLIVACDMPGLKTAWLRHLMDRAKVGGRACVVCRDCSGKVHPLCAVYNRTCLPHIDRAVGEHRLRLLDLINDLDTEFVGIAEPMANVNTPQDWEAWHHLASARDAGIALPHE